MNNGVQAASAEMPRYKSHKHVWALKIAEIVAPADAIGAELVPEDKAYAPIKVSSDYMTKHKPQIGGYFVVYQDGYRSFSPAEAFEGGYTRSQPIKAGSGSRLITSHMVNPANDVIQILVNDPPGAGGANHRYELTGFDTGNNPSRCDEHGYATSFSKLVILFQNGPIAEAGVNGITQEVLIAICIDRLECFQRGPYACDANAIALARLTEAQVALQARTRERMARNVEGTHQK